MALPAVDPTDAPGTVFPLIPQYAYIEGLRFRTIIADFETGKEQRFQKWSRSKKLFSLDFGVLDFDDAKTLFAFYEARGGPAESFLLENLNELPVTAEAVGQASVGGSFTGTLDNTQIRKNSVTITANGDTATDDGAGLLSGDFTGTIDYITGAITLSGTTGNASITAAYQFYRRVRFVDDLLERAMFARRLFNTKVVLIEVF